MTGTETATYVCHWHVTERDIARVEEPSACANAAKVPLGAKGGVMKAF